MPRLNPSTDGTQLPNSQLYRSKSALRNKKELNLASYKFNQEKVSRPLSVVNRDLNIGVSLRQ